MHIINKNSRFGILWMDRWGNGGWGGLGEGAGGCNGLHCVQRCSRSFVASGGNWNPPTSRVWAGLAPQGALCSPPAVLGVDGVSDKQAWADEHFQAGVVAKGGFEQVLMVVGDCIPGEALQDVKAKELIALILIYLLPFDGGVTEGVGDPPLEVRNDFFAFVFEEQGLYPRSYHDSSSPSMRSRMVVSFTYKDDVIVAGGGAVMCVFWAWSPSSLCQVCLSVWNSRM